MGHDGWRPDSRSGALRMIALAVVAAFACSCAGTETTSSPGSNEPAPASTPSAGIVVPSSSAVGPSPTVRPAASTPSGAPVTPSPTLAKAGWSAAGTMHLARVRPAVLRLGDGRVLVVGNAVTDTYTGSLPDDSTRVTELFSPSDATWRTGPSLNAPRDEFAAVVLNDGRALIIGGLSQASASFSSTYLFDPATDAWVKSGLLGTARYGSAAAVLPDGRVLVAGGRYSTGSGDYHYGAADGMRLADYEPEADVDPGPTGHPVATAELYEPRTGAWSSTGSMRWARYGASAVTLGDGRVLVCGGDEYAESQVGPRCEVFDRSTGRFGLAPSLPVPSPELLSSIGLTITGADLRLTWYLPPLSRLANGDGLLTGLTAWANGVDVEASLRFDSSAGAWVPVGTPYAERHSGDNGEAMTQWGTKRPSRVTASLSDNRVVFVSEEDGQRVDVLDAVTARWSRLASVPAKMIGATGIELADRSLLLVPSKGGYTDAYRYVFGS